MKKKPLIHTKKAIVPYMLIFIATLISSMIIFIAHNQSEDMKTNSLYIESEKINAKFNVMKNEIKHAILNSNANTQEDLTPKFIENEIDEEEYRESVVENINQSINFLNDNVRYFSSSQITLNDNTIELDVQETSGEISITKKLSFKINWYREEFFEQISILKNINSKITSIQEKNTSCNSPLEDNSCISYISSQIEKNYENMRCEQIDSSNIEELECFFITTPFSVTKFTIEGIEPQRKREPPKVEQNLIRFSESQQDIRIYLNQLPFKEENLEEFILFFIPSNNYNVENAINTFESTILPDKTGITRLENINTIVTSNDFKQYLVSTNSSFEDSSTAKTYKANIDSTNLYFKIVQKQDENVVSLNSLFKFLELSNLPQSIVVVDNEIFEGISMYERSVEIQVPKSTQSSNSD